MIRNLTKAWRYLCFQRHRRTNLNAYLNIPVKVSFFWKGIHQSGLVIETMIQKHLKGLKRIEILNTSHMKVFLDNEYNSYTHTARNAKVTSTRIVYEKTLMKRKVFRGVFRTHSNIYDEAFLRR